jgi:hypothetical protein
MLSNYYMCSSMYLYTLRATSSLLYVIFSPFTFISSRKGLHLCRTCSSRILLIMQTNCITEFIAPYKRVIILIKLRGIINIIKSLLYSTSSIWSYSEKKLIRDATAHLIKSSENLLTVGGRFIS